MIGDAGTGSGFGGLQAYLLHGHRGEAVDRVGWVSSRNLAHDDPEYAAVQMRATAEQNHRVEQPVYHLSLNAAPGEHLSREQWEQVADRVLKDLGLEDHQALIVAHTDRPHEHVHVMVNRVSPETLKTWSNSHDYARIERSLRHIERERGLREVPGHHYRLEREQQAPDRSPGLTSGEVQQRQRTGQEPFAEQARFRLYNDFKEAGSWADLEERLAGHGMRLEKRGRGLVVTDGERQVKASRIHRGRSLGKLEERYGMTFNDWRGRVAELRSAVQDYETTEARHTELTREHARSVQALGRVRELTEPLQALKQQQREAGRRLEDQLRTVYRPDSVQAARRALEAEAHLHGHRRAAERLRRDPGRYGRLAGRGGPLPDVTRREAVATVPRAAESLERLGAARREMARTLDRQARGAWEAAGRPLEAPDSLTQARWTVEHHRERLEELLPRVYRAEAVPRVLRSLEQSPDPARTAEQLARNPGRFGPMHGTGAGPLQTEARREATRHAPGLARAARDFGAAREALRGQVLTAHGRALRDASRQVRTTGRSLRRLPGKSQALGRVAQAAQRVGMRALAHVVPLPPKLALVKFAVNAVRRLAELQRGGRGR
jgi:hypothetical protein